MAPILTSKRLFAKPKSINSNHPGIPATQLVIFIKLYPKDVECEHVKHPLGKNGKNDLENDPNPKKEAQKPNNFTDFLSSRFSSSYHKFHWLSTWVLKNPPPKKTMSSDEKTLMTFHGKY